MSSEHISKVFSSRSPQCARDATSTNTTRSVKPLKVLSQYVVLRTRFLSFSAIKTALFERDNSCHNKDTFEYFTSFFRCRRLYVKTGSFLLKLALAFSDHA